MPTLNSLARLHQALTTEAHWRRPPVTVASAAKSATTIPPATSDPAPVPMPDEPLRLTDDQLTTVLRAAEPLAVGDRGAFLQDVAAALHGQELGDGTVHRAVAQAQRKYYDPPDTRLAVGALNPIPEPLASERASMSGSSTSSICASMASCSLRSTRPSKQAGVLKDWEEIRYNESGA